MENFSVAVALFDYVPVALSAFALAFLARGISAALPPLTRAAWTAAVLIPLGGLCKASWKLIIALYQTPLPWLENLLFLLLAPGFLIMAFCLHHARRQSSVARGRLLAWTALAPAGAGLAVLMAGDSRLWFFWLLGLTTLGTISLLTQATLSARAMALGWLPPVCFGVSLIASLSLGGLSRLPDGESTAWIQQSVNTVSQFALLIGCWMLGRRMYRARGTNNEGESLENSQPCPVAGRQPAMRPAGLGGRSRR